MIYDAVYSMVNGLLNPLDRKQLKQMLLKYLECFAGGQLREEAQFVVPQVQLLERCHLCQDRRHALQLIPRAVQHSQVYRRKRLNKCFPEKQQLNQQQSDAYSSFR